MPTLLETHGFKQPMKANTKLKKEDDPRAYKMLKREVDLSCSFCKPHRGENAKRRKHVSKPKRKDKR